MVEYTDMMVESDVKDEKFFLRRMEYYYGLYSRDNTAIGNGGMFFRGSERRSIKELRDHARGLQNVNKYKDLCDPVDKKTGKRMWNISWQPATILSKFRNIVKDKMTSLMLEPITEANDEAARIEKSNIKNLLKILRQDETAQMTDGVQFDEPSEFSDAESPEDVDAIYEMGGIRLAVEIMMKDAIDITLYRSRWDTLSGMIAEDIVDLNAFAADQEVINTKQELKYVDLPRVVIRPSIYPDFRDSDFRGYVSNMKISEIRRFVTDEKVLKSIERKVKGRNHQSDFNDQNRGFREDYSRSNDNFRTYNDFGVEVLKMYFLDTQRERFVSGVHKNGSRVFERVPLDFVLSERGMQAGKEIVERNPMYLYQCYWVVGTDTVFNYGPVEGIARDSEMNVIWPLTVYMGHEQSLIEKCIGFDDDLQLANYKVRHLIAKMPPGPRMIIYKDVIRDSVKIAGEQFSIIDIIGKYQSDGMMILDRREYSLPGEGDSKKPIDFIPAGIAEDLMILKQRIFEQVDFMRQTTGLNEVADGTSQTPDMLKSVMQGLTQATNSALGPYINMYIRGFKSIIEHIGYKYQVLVLNGTVDVGTMPMGTYIKRVLLDDKIRQHSFNIMVRVQTLEDKQMLMNYLMSRQDALGADAYFAVLNCIMGNDLKKAQFLLSKYWEKAVEQQHANQVEIAQATAKGNAEAAIATEQAKSQTLQAENGFLSERMRLEFDLQNKLDQENHLRKMKEIELENLYKMETGVKVVRANNQNRADQ